MNPGNSTAGPIGISVVVNTVDRAASLQTLLAALEHQRYPAFEVIVVVGPTKDSTVSLLRTFGDRVRVLRCPAANLSRSRNMGLLAARGEIVAFIDDDAVPCVTWLAQLARAFEDPLVAATGGAVYAIHPAQPGLQHRLGVISDLGEQHNVHTGPGAVPLAGMGRAWTSRPMGTNMAVRRQQLLALGGFDEFYGWVYDDADLAMRLAQAGHQVRLLEEAPVYHVPASSRNRVVRTFAGRWWIGVAAAAYFAVRNGRAAGQPTRDILRRIVHVVHGEWLLSGELRRAGKIGCGAMWQRRARGSVAGLQGMLAGLFGRRRLLSDAARSQAYASGRPLRPFLRPTSPCVAAVDPVNGNQAEGTCSAPPLRIALVAPAFPEAQATSAAGDPGFAAATLAADLLAQGHTVHLLIPDNRDELAFHHGAYVHRFTQDSTDDNTNGPTASDSSFVIRHSSFIALLHRLLHNDAIEIVDFLPANAGVKQPDELCALVEAYRRCIIERSAMAAPQSRRRPDDRR